MRVCWGDAIDPAVHRDVRSFAHALAEGPLSGVVEAVPSYTAVTVFYRPHEIRYEELCRALEKLAASMSDAAPPPSEILTLPVLYGGEHGPDLAFVAERAGLAAEEVVALHSRPDYLVYMIGFAPGFPYLGGLPERLETPRLESPRRAVPAGSVGIGGAQTGVYPLESPGGWRLIGRTPVPLFRPRETPPVLLKAGDVLRFRPVDAGEYRAIEEQVRRGTYAAERKPRT